MGNEFHLLLGNEKPSSLEASMVELESELRRRLEIEADNAKLKQENAALIRIISKLSK